MLNRRQRGLDIVRANTVSLLAHSRSSVRLTLAYLLRLPDTQRQQHAAKLPLTVLTLNLPDWNLNTYV